MALLVPLLSALVLGYLCVRAAGLRPDRPERVWLICALAGGLGIGITSVVHFVSLCVTGRQTVANIALEGLVALALLAGVIARRRVERGNPTSVDPAQSTTPIPGPLITALVALAVIGIATFWVQYLKHPHGVGDALDIWNLRSRFLFRGELLWSGGFTALATAHPDYPLLLPCSIARCWQHIGSASTSAPAWLGFVFACSTAGLLYAGLAELTRPIRGVYATIALLGVPAFVATSAEQYADVPLAFFILATLVLVVMARHAEDGAAGLAVLAGLSAGMAAWTKNEGLLLAPTVAAIWLLRPSSREIRGRGLEVVYFVAGAVPVLLVVAYFKFVLAPDNELIAGLTMSHLGTRLTDGTRYLAIAERVVGYLTGPGLLVWILVPGFLLIVRHQRVRTTLEHVRRQQSGRREWTGIAAVILIGGAYGLIYLATSERIVWHLATSLDRLFLQLTPTLLFSLFVVDVALGAWKTPGSS